MELPSKLLERIAYHTRNRTEEQMLIVMHISTHEEHLSQLLQTNKKQFKIALTFLSAYNGIFNITNSYDKFYFKNALTDESCVQITITLGTYEIESLDDEFKRIIIDKSHYTEANYPFKIKPIFSTLGSILEISPHGPIISFVFDYNIGNLLGFHETILWPEYNLSSNPVDFSSFDNFFSRM